MIYTTNPSNVVILQQFKKKYKKDLTCFMLVGGKVLIGKHKIEVKYNTETYYNIKMTTNGYYKE